MFSLQRVWLRQRISFVLLTGSSSRPDWCAGSSAYSHMSVVQLTHPPFCTSSIWQDPLPSLSLASSWVLLSVSCCGPDVCIVVYSLFSCYPSPNCSLRCRRRSTDGRLMHKTIHFTQNTNAIVMLNNRDTTHPKRSHADCGKSSTSPLRQ